MKIETIDFYYFSGTGNTLLVVRKNGAKPSKGYDIKWNIYSIENSNPRKNQFKSHNRIRLFQLQIFPHIPLSGSF